MVDYPTYSEIQNALMTCGLFNSASIASFNITQKIEYPNEFSCTTEIICYGTFYFTTEDFNTVLSQKLNTTIHLTSLNTITDLNTSRFIIDFIVYADLPYLSSLNDTVTVPIKTVPTPGFDPYLNQGILEYINSSLGSKDGIIEVSTNGENWIRIDSKELEVLLKPSQNENFPWERIIKSDGSVINTRQPSPPKEAAIEFKAKMFYRRIKIPNE